MRLTDLKDAIKAGRSVYRQVWPSYAAWFYNPNDGLRFVGRTKAEWFWREIVEEPVRNGIPGGLMLEDLDATDWELL